MPIFKLKALALSNHQRGKEKKKILIAMNEELTALFNSLVIGVVSDILDVGDAKIILEVEVMNILAVVVQNEILC